MKKLIALLILMIFAINANALTLEWTPNTEDTDGYIIYWQKKGNTDPAKVYHQAIEGMTSNQITLPNSYFERNEVYQFWATAYNSVEESEDSQTIEHSVSGFSPPADNLPVEFYEGPGQIVIVINTGQ